MESNSVIKDPYASTIAEVLSRFETTEHGLSPSQVAERQRRSGPNRLPEQGPTSLTLIVLRQFINPLIYILVAAAVVSAVIGDLKSALFIFVVLILNAAIGAYQEAHAERSSHALRRLLRIHALVERSGETLHVNAEDVVVGDVVWLESGNRIPADIRLISVHGFEVDESLLTGESLAIAKNSDWLAAAPTSLADQQNMAFAGSMVSRGRAKGVVVAIAMQTEIGKLALDTLGATPSKPPLIIRMERFTRLAAMGTMIAASVIGLLGMLFGHYSLTETFFFVIALAVSAIPEGLPVAMTVALAVAATRMAQRRVIVRQLTAVEGLGSCTLIATDKTGTLTCNELTVREIGLANGTIYHVTGEGFQPHGTILKDGQTIDINAEPGLADSIRATMHCNEAELHHRHGRWISRGDAVDVAALVLGEKAGIRRATIIEQYPPVAVIPFEPEHRFAASFHQDSDSTVVFAKGAPEQILKMCHSRLSPAEYGRAEALAHDMARRGLRVIAIARGGMNRPLPLMELAHTSDLQFLGFLGMLDPLRPGAREAIARCRSAGVQVTMVTGDHCTTATAIARDLGLVTAEDQVLTADELVGKTDQELAPLISRVRVFARVSPRQKLEIVSAARRAGHFVAVTGDGANDAPALRAANIGVAMGIAGTDVAREAAELVLADDNFSSIVAGIEEGRIAYDNIRKVIFLLIPAGCAELLMVLLAVVFALPVPLLPVQLLWLNLVTDGIQGVALAFEPGEGAVLRRKPRPPRESIFNRMMIERSLISIAVMGIGGFLVYHTALQLGYETAAARNLLLLAMVLFEIFHVGNCRSETNSAFTLSPLRSPVLLFGTLAAFLIHLAGMYVPFLQNILATSPVDLKTWLIMTGVAILILPGIELHKWLSQEPQTRVD